MKRLRAEVYRSGETVSQWHHETDDVTIGRYGDGKSEVDIRFKLASKGGGITDVSLRIGQIGFDNLLNEMWKAAPERVVALMARQMNGHFWPE
jgi:hypothetical protein